MTELSKAVVLITGADGGFGRQMTRQFLEAGSRLILSDLNENRLARLQADAASGSGEILAAIPVDLSQTDDCQHLYDEVLKTNTIPDVIVPWLLRRPPGPRTSGVIRAKSNPW